MYYFIVNYTGGGGKARKTWNRVHELLKDKKIDYKAYVTKYPGHAGELAAKENLVRYQNLFFHYTGILSIRLWWRPPSNWVESHVFRMRVAIG